MSSSKFHHLALLVALVLQFSEFQFCHPIVRLLNRTFLLNTHLNNKYNLNKYSSTAPLIIIMHSTDSQQCLSLELLSTTCIFHTLEIYTLQAFTLLKYHLHLPAKEDQKFLVKSCEENKMNDLEMIWCCHQIIHIFLIKIDLILENGWSCSSVSTLQVSMLCNKLSITNYPQFSNTVLSLLHRGIAFKDHSDIYHKVQTFFSVIKDNYHGNIFSQCAFGRNKNFM